MINRFFLTTVLSAFILTLLCFVPFAVIAAPEDLTAERTVLENGLTVITRETHSRPIVSVHLFCRTGPIYENEKNLGISHFYEHLFFKGTPRRSALQMKREIDSKGGELNAATYKDFTQFYINIASDYLDDALDLISDALIHATSESQEMEKERKVVLEEIGLNEESPQSIMTNLFYRTAFKQHPYSKPIYGTPETIKGITREDVLAFKNRFYVAPNLTLVVAGDFKTKPTLEKIKRYFADVPSKKVETPAVPIEPAQQDIRRHVEEMNITRAYFMLGFPVAGMKDRDDIYPLDVLTFLLGQGRGSRLNTQIKEKQGLAWTIAADFLTQRFPGTLEVIATFDQEKMAPLEAAVLSEIRKVRSGEISDRELERAKTLLETTYTFGNESLQGQASTLGFYEAIGNYAFALDYVDRIRHTTKEDVVRVANKYLKENTYSIIILKPKTKKTGGINDDH